MPTLRLHSLVCDSTENDIGDDVIYNTVKGKKAWGPKDMNTSPPGHKTRAVNEEVKFTEKIRIELWREDTDWGDDDPQVGKTYAYAAEAGKGEIEYVFRAC